MIHTAQPEAIPTGVLFPKARVPVGAPRRDGVRNEQSKTASRTDAQRASNPAVRDEFGISRRRTMEISLSQDLLTDPDHRCCFQTVLEKMQMRFLLLMTAIQWQDKRTQASAQGHSAYLGFG